MPSYTQIHNYILLQLFNTKFRRNIARHNTPPVGRALVYYKNTSLTPGYIHDYSHTNLWEISCLVKCLNRLGVIVDALDRSLPTNFQPQNIYDLFVGIGTDDSGQHFPFLAKQLPRAVKILYAATSAPDQRNANIKKRHQQFNARHNHQLPLRRLVTQSDLPTNMALTDHIFCVGNDHTMNPFHTFNKPVHKIWLSTAPHLSLDRAALVNKHRNNWLFFAGHGNILKGLDLVIEAFANLPELDIYICTILEPAIRDYYQPLLNKSTNIHLEGFLEVGSKRFQHLTSLCGYNILPSCSEGTATSVTTCMRRGLIPVVTPEAGVDINGFGFLIKDISLPQLSQQILSLSNLPKNEFQQRIIDSYQASSHYTQTAYEQSIYHALLQVVTSHPKLKQLFSQ